MKKEWKTIDYHVGGEAVRVFQTKYEHLSGATMLQKRENLKKDILIQCTIREPRGHAGMYAAVLTEPVEKESAVGALFACNDRCFPMFCGHALLGAACAAVDLGWVSAPENGSVHFRIDVPSGTVEAVVERKKGKIIHVAFVNQPCFVLETEYPVQTSKFGIIPVAVAWSGSFMTYVPAEVLGDRLDASVIPKAMELGYEIDCKLREGNHDFVHPEKSLHLRDSGSLVCFVTDPIPCDGGYRANTLNIIDKNNYDRGAAGTATCARAALLQKQGLQMEGKTLFNYCITGQHYDAKVLALTKAGEIEAVIPELSAKVYPMGESSFCVMPDDPFPEGFLS